MPESKKPTIIPGKRESFTNEGGVDYGNGKLTIQDLNAIMEVNQKALTIYLEVEKQNETVIESLEKIDEIEILTKSILQGQKDIMDQQKEMIKLSEETNEEIEVMNKAIEALDKSFFRLIIILGSTVTGILITIVQNFLQKK